MRLAGVLVAMAVATAAARHAPPLAVRRRLHVFTSPGRRGVPPPWLLAGPAAAVGAGAGSWLGPVGSLAGAAGATGAVLTAAATRRRRRDRRLAAQVPEALELMAGAIRAGRSIRQALPAGAAAGPPLGPVLDQAAAAAEVGRPLGEVLASVSRSEPALASACAALGVGLVAGGDVARGLDRLAAAARQRMRLDAEMISLTAQVRLSAVVLALLPVITLILFTAAGSPEQRAFLREPLGQACLAGGLLLDAGGYALLRRLGQPTGGG